MQPSLAALMDPRTIPEFRASVEVNEAWVVHGPRPSVESLTRLPLLASLQALLDSWPNQVQVHLPDARDEVSFVDASPRDARKLFDNGMGLLFNHMEAISPELKQWLGAIQRDAGLSDLTQGRCLVYATPAGKGTAPHFDQNLNFVLQLSGTKTWWLAPNRHVQNPMTRHTMGLAPDPELQIYARQPLPQRMPAGSRSVVLEAGSLLCVPRGMWHSTEASTDALSLNFTYSAPTWIDVFTAALRTRLAMSPRWRATAEPLAESTLDELLAELAHDASHWKAADILAVTEGGGSDPDAGA